MLSTSITLSVATAKKYTPPQSKLWTLWLQLLTPRAIATATPRATSTVTVSRVQWGYIHTYAHISSCALSGYVSILPSLSLSFSFSLFSSLFAAIQIESARHLYTCHAAPWHAPVPHRAVPQLALSRTDVRAYYCKLNSITSDSRQIEVEIEIFFGCQRRVKRKKLNKNEKCGPFSFALPPCRNIK